jgi:hypothetical protein
MRNKTTIAPVGCAALTACGLIILATSLAGAEYGPRTTIGKSYQQYSNTTSTNGINPGTCGGSSFCYVMFQVAPQQQTLTIQHVACLVGVTPGGLNHVRLGTRKGQTFLQRYTPLVPVHTTGTWWAVNGPVMHLIKSGERPYVIIGNSQNATNWLPSCSISGTLR